MAEVTELIEYTINAPREAVLGWKYDRVTKLVLELVKEEIHDYEQRMGRGETLGDNTTKDTARCVGRIEGLGFLQELLEAQFLSGEDTDGEDTSSRAGDDA